MKINEAFRKVFKEQEIKLKEDIKNIHMDSRLVCDGDVFFAIGGGNRFITSTLEKGAALVVYDDPAIDVKDNRAVLVADTVNAMQEIAKTYRKMLDVKIVGITGTNGKTSTKDIVHSILSQKYKGIKSQGNYNNHIGLPYTILQIRETDEFAVLEMGMSSFGEIDLLCDISGINYGIITNIGESHLEFLGTVANVFKAKGEMIKYLDEDKIIVFGDDEYLHKVAGIKVGFEPDNNYILTNVVEDENGVRFELNSEEYYLPINGYYNAINASLGIALGNKLEINYEQMKCGLENSRLSAMRYEKTLIKNRLYINDAYNADPLSVKSALKSFDKLYNSTYKVLVLADMLELGENSKGYHIDLKDDILKTQIDKVYLYGEEMKALKEALKESDKVAYFSEKKDIKKEIDKIDVKTTVLLKGSRGMKLEEIIG